MKIKKILKWIYLIFIFILISSLFFKIVTYIMKPETVDLYNIAGFYAEDKNSLDMVYIGGSAAFVYWEPLRAFETYGIASYNYGANTIQAELYKTMVKEVLKKQNPEVILIDARAFQYREKDEPPTEIAYRNVLTGMPLSLNKIEFISKNVKKYLNQDTTSYYFDIIKYHRDTKDLTFKNQLRMAFNKYENPIKGFYFVHKVAPIETFENQTSKKKAIDKETESILTDLLEYLKTTNIKFLFVVSPYAEKMEHKENFNYIQEIINNYGYDFLDFNDFDIDMNLNFDIDFYNNNHVNIFGAEKYTDFLAKYLKENYKLSDRRKDTDYQDWQELLPDWNKQVDEAKEIINELIEEERWNIY